jgi:hypothetical protein
VSVDMAIELETVRVSRTWNGFRRACRVLLEDLQDPYWTYCTGGRRIPLMTPYIGAYITCDRLARDVGHSCTPAHGEWPHKIKVLVLPALRDKAIYRKLMDAAGPRPPRPRFIT